MYDLMNDISLADKLEILSDAAKYDVACTSSGVDRRGKKGHLGNSCAAGICHSFAADGRCVSLLKILMTNHCSYDCKYCKNRRSNDIPRATFTPEEICTLTIEFYKRNYIEGLFLSSGVLKNPDYTMEKICEALRMLRTQYHFNGYIHVKAIPGASSELIYSAGLLADRISINMELPTQDSLSTLAPNKNMQTILKPMNQISETIAANRLSIGKDARMERSGINKHLINSIFGPESDPVKLSGSSQQSQIDHPFDTQHFGNNPFDTQHFGNNPFDNNQGNYLFADNDRSNSGIITNNTSIFSELSQNSSSGLLLPASKTDLSIKRPFASAGQSTQMIIGASNETDLDLIRTTQSLYQSFDLKRVFYSAYIPLNEDEALPSLDTPVPLLREHRLYQADWLLRFYGFHADELLTRDEPNFDSQIDPKCNWAIRHLDQFPVEVNTASYDMLLRVPGIGPTGVKKIMSARRYSKVNFDMLKKMHITLKRARYFITCNGKMLDRIPIEQQFIKRSLIEEGRIERFRIAGNEVETQQMNLFTDFGVSV